MTSTTQTSTVKLEEIALATNAREDFDPEALAELTASIKETGLATALTVYAEGEGFVLVAGERRYRAAKAAGLKEVPVLLVAKEGAEALQSVENMQRQDLNLVEQARSLKTIGEAEGLKAHKAIAKRVGKSTAFVSERMRLLALPEGCHPAFAEGKLPLSAEPTLRKIAKVSPEAAVAASELVREGDHSAHQLVNHTGDVLRIAVERKMAALLDLTDRSVSVDAAITDEAKRERLYAETPEEIELDYLHLEESDVDRLRAAGRLIEIPSGFDWQGPDLFLADAELAVDLVEQLVARRVKEREERAKQVAEEAGADPAHGKSAGEQTAEAERAERAKERAMAEREREKATGYNDRVGSSLLNRRGKEARKAHRLVRAKFLALQVLADNPELPAKGLRLALPQLRSVETVNQKNGKRRLKASYAEKDECLEYVRDSIERAKSVDEVLEIITDAFLAAELVDERAIALSKRANWWTRTDVAKALGAEIKEAKPKRS